MKQTLLILIGSVILFLALGQFFFWGDWYFIALSLIPGFVISFYFKQQHIVKFASALAIASVIFGLLSITSVETLHVLRTDAPFDWPVIFKAALIFSFACYIGGLAGAIIKSFWAFQHNKV